jgi:hypothetical protein
MKFNTPNQDKNLEPLMFMTDMGHGVTFSAFMRNYSQFNTIIMKQLLFISMLTLILVSCEKRVPQDWGDLLIITEYDGMAEENVEVTLYSSYDNFVNYVFLERQLSDETGEVFFPELIPGWYYVEAERQKSSLFKLYAMDSIPVEGSQQTNKILIMEPVD